MGVCFFLDQTHVTLRAQARQPSIFGHPPKHFLLSGESFGVFFGDKYGLPFVSRFCLQVISHRSHQTQWRSLLRSRVVQLISYFETSCQPDQSCPKWWESEFWLDPAKGGWVGGLRRISRMFRHASFTPKRFGVC